MSESKQIAVAIYVNTLQWDELTIILNSEKCLQNSITDEEPLSANAVSMNGILASCFVSELRKSQVYQQLVWTNFAKNHSRTVKLAIKLSPVTREVIDYSWCNGIQRQVYERIELDHMMSWLSTLGGAFSSLGEHFSYCAEMAGKISIQQYRIAVGLGDPFTVARCRLFLAISLIQRERLRSARFIVRDVYRFAQSRPGGLYDQRLVAMCHGIWAKLRYVWRLKYSVKG